MQACIFDKLLQWNRIDRFYGSVIKAQSDLQSGVLLNAREVGVKLVVDGRVSHKPQTLLDSIK